MTELKVHDRIYMDHAATTWPKPESVLLAADRYARNIGAAAGRGGYSSARQADDLIQRTRAKIARYISAADPNSIAFTSSGTHSLNVAIAGILRPGDHVVTTAVEHNSVLRVLAHLQRASGIQWTMVECDHVGRVSPENIAAAIRPETKLIVVSHGSNVTGAVAEAAQIGQIAKKHNIAFCLDAAQTLGYVPISVDEISVDLLAAPGHKGLWGLAGTGVLYVHSRYHASLEPLLFGGTGRDSELVDAPFRYPGSIEVGNQNMCGIASIEAGVDELASIDIVARRQRLVELSDYFSQELRQIAGIQLFRAEEAEEPLPVFSLTADWASPHELAALLDSSFGIEVRSGLHCSGAVHRFLRTSGTGTVRFSFGHSTTADEVDAALVAMRELASAMG